MPRKKTRSAAQKSVDPERISPELQARTERFARALGRIILTKIDPEAARRMAEDGS
jgi:hypothetical protein